VRAVAGQNLGTIGSSADSGDTLRQSLAGITVIIVEKLGFCAPSGPVQHGWWGDRRLAWLVRLSPASFATKKSLTITTPHHHHYLSWHAVEHGPAFVGIILLIFIVCSAFAGWLSFLIAPFLVPACLHKLPPLSWGGLLKPQHMLKPGGDVAGTIESVVSAVPASKVRYLLHQY
jgi:hypothetical protein